MKIVTTDIAYGKGYLPVNLNSGSLLGIIKPKCEHPILKNFKVGSDFQEKIKDKNNILIVVPDNTRHCHLKIILPPLLKLINHEKAKVKVLIATGLHKKPNEAQLTEMFGSEIIDKYEIISHEQRPENIKEVGKTTLGVPITLNKMLFQSDFIITVGVAEPHLYAGFSGGPKTIAIGLAGEQTINATHSLKFLGDQNTKLCTTDINPFHNTLWEIVNSVRVGYAINIINNTEGNLINIYSGALKEVYTKAINFIKKHFIITVEKEADVLICGLGFPKDINLYQVSRVINYSLDTKRPIVRKGGIIIIAAELSEDAGKGLGEIRFFQDLTHLKNTRRYLEKVKKTGFVAGEHRTFMVAKHLNDYEVIFVSSKLDLFKNTPFVCYATMEEAIEHAKRKLREEFKAYVYPKTLNSIALVGD